MICIVAIAEAHRGLTDCPITFVTEPQQSCYSKQTTVFEPAYKAIAVLLVD
jgi:hypothetical protein